MSDLINQPTPQQVGAEFLSQHQRVTADPVHAAVASERVFRTMHGFYGSLWLNKFSTGTHNAQGEDAGVMSARKLWGTALARYSTDVVRTALGRCLSAHAEFPPNLPQFVALCEASRPREVYRPPANAIGMSGELRSAYARRLREANARHTERARDRAAGGSGRHTDGAVTGLPLLHSLIAESVALAGGDEAATLLRLECSQPPPLEVVSPPARPRS